MKKNKQNIFILGFPAPVAGISSDFFLKNNFNVTLLIDESDTNNIHLKQWGKKYNSTLHIVKGTSSSIDFALSGKDYLELAKQTDFIIACHSITSVKTRSFYKAEVKELIEFCKASQKKASIVYFSTLTVSGNFSGIFSEKDLETGQNFTDSLQEGLFYAERILNKFKDQINSCIVRTALPVGNRDYIFPLILFMSIESEIFFKFGHKYFLFTPLKQIELFYKVFLKEPDTLFLPSSRTLHLFTKSKLSSGELTKKIYENAHKEISTFFDIKKAAKTVIDIKNYSDQMDMVIKNIFVKQHDDTDISNKWSTEFLSTFLNRQDRRFLLNIFKWDDIIETAVEKIAGFR